MLDQFPLWLDAVEQVLTRVGMEVIGKSVEPDDAIGLIQKLQPDILVAEVGDDEAVVLLRRVRKLAPDLKVIALSHVEALEHVDATLAAGAVAYVLKTADPEDLALAIRQTFAQSVYFADGRSGAQPVGYEAGHPSQQLTRREREILQLVAQGDSNGQLARTLWVTEQTIKFHLSNIYRKLEVANRTEASRWAHLHGLVSTAEAEAAPAAA